jgi:Luciferase-like monooxygenase
MPTGVVLYPNPNAVNVVDDVVSQARRAYELGVRQVWLAQQFDHDAIALAGLVGAAVPGLGVGTSVVPINPRHPLIVGRWRRRRRPPRTATSVSASGWARMSRSDWHSALLGRTRSAGCAST